MSAPPVSASRVAVLMLVSAVAGAGVLGAWIHRDALLPSGATAATGPAVREFHLDIVPQDVPMGEEGVWHAWTFNGTVPGPTLTAYVGDVIRVTVHNKHDLTHSFHTHLSPYALESDGSQLNSITGIGGMAMIPPGGSYTYEFAATMPGLFYYHCHSADGHLSIAQHILQGLYGAILVKSREEAPIRDEVVFMAERGHEVDGQTPYFIMNGKGIPGGEHALEELAKEGGLDAVKAQFGKTVPVISAKVGEPIRISVVNIGDMAHSFHLHGFAAYMVDHDKGEPLPAQVLGLVPGEADRIVVTPTQPGVWLFHCHVVSHADGGMIGVMMVEPESS
jgi:manganese oxidase